MAKTRKLKKKYKKFLFLIFILVLVVGFTYIYRENVKQEFIRLKLESEALEKEKREREEEEKRKLEEYNICVSKEYDESELSLDLSSIKHEIDALIVNNKYKTSVKYEDIETGFSYEYREDSVYYGCSLIKIVDALYLINEAINGNIDLDTEKIVYTSKYKSAYSSGMANYNYGDSVSLRDLITYAVNVSDNSAHLMLIDYIGFDTLQEYGRSLGATNILTGSDKFGNQSAVDTNIYLKEAYRIISEDEVNGPFLKSIMDNDERNAFNNGNIRIYHKYGAYAQNFHDIGLNLDNEYPYSISIFTLHEDGIYKEVIQNIHSKIIELHDTFHNNRKENCYKEVYES